jgi:hypothetical protein
LIRPRGKTVLYFRERDDSSDDAPDLPARALMQVGRVTREISRLSREETRVMRGLDVVIISMKS